MSGDFCIVLPSNTKTDIFQDNKTGDYEISLPRAMEFGGTTYEVALCEIHFPHTWLNIKPPMLGVTFTALKNEKMWEERRVEYHRKIDEGYYETVDYLLEAVNEQNFTSFWGSFKIRQANNYVKLVLHPRERVVLHEDLAAMLGFENRDMGNYDYDDRSMVHKAKYMPDIHAVLHNLYVYSNIVKHTLVGNEYFPLLRIIDARGQHGGNVYKSFQNPFYVEAKYDRIASIHISLCDNQGDIVKLTSGKIICILHFRRKLGVGL